MSDLTTMDAMAQADLVRQGKVSALELVDAAIARVERVNPTVNAVVHTMFEQARRAARREKVRKHARHATSCPRGPG